MGIFVLPSFVVPALIKACRGLRRAVNLPFGILATVTYFVSDILVIQFL